MRKLILHTTQYHYLEKGFAEWLDILGYNAMTVYNMPNIVHEFFHYLESRQITNIKAVEQIHFKGYYDHISGRANQRRGGGLSEKYLLMHMQALEKFLEYLHHRNIEAVATTGVKLTTPQRKQITVLTEHEIKLLFEVTSRESNTEKQEAINVRDKIILVVFYSCGLRRNEGVNVSIDDINLDTRLLHVRKGKNYKERFVPFNKTNAAYLQEYIYDHRPLLTGDKKDTALFISSQCCAMPGGSLYGRLKLLQQQTEDITLQQKTIGLHTLRHSIATHLLAAGMSLEKIARFLGHSSLDSTQIYTHLVEKEQQQ